MAVASSSVPCGSCTLCCHRQKVWLFAGEDAQGLRTTPDINHVLQRRMIRLEQKPNGECAHLGPGGCEVYEIRPRVCRMFDCREHYHKPAAERRRLEAIMAPHDIAICRRGRELVEAER